MNSTEQDFYNELQSNNYDFQTIAFGCLRSPCIHKIALTGPVAVGGFVQNITACRQRNLNRIS
jgi:hypothetical protein